MKVLFRVDASVEIGSGHVMRCCHLAHSLRQQGADVAFAGYLAEGHLLEWLQEQGFNVFALKPGKEKEVQSKVPHAHWLQGTVKEDVKQTKDILKKWEQVDWVVVDHFGLDAEWEKQVQQEVSNIMVIDDLADRPHDCRLLLDVSSLQAGNRYDNLVNLNCQRLEGVQYALVPQDFTSLRPSQPKLVKDVKNIAVFLGMSDLGAGHDKVLSAFECIKNPAFTVHYIVGPHNPNKEELMNRISKTPYFKTYEFVKNMAQWMSGMDMYVGSGGVVTWERSCLGVSGIVVGVALNQEEGSQRWGELGCHTYLGRNSEVSAEVLAQEIQKMVKNPSKLNEMGKKSWQMVDGQGINRILKALGVLPVFFRKAQKNDCEKIYQWRNHEWVREFALDSREISLEDHVEWFEKSLENPHRDILIAEGEIGPVGVLRFDHEKDFSEVSVYLVPERIGEGWGLKVLNSGSAWISQHRPGIKSLKATIKPDNLRSIKVFHRAGYVQNKDAYWKEV